MKGILKSIAIVAFVVGIASTATWALLSDQDTVGSSTFTMTSTEPDIVIDEDGVYDENSEGTDFPINLDELYPSYMSDPYYVAITNQGELDFNWTFTNLLNPGETLGTGGGSLHNVLKVKIEAAMDTDDVTLKQYNYQSGFNCKSGSLNWQPIYGWEAEDATAPGDPIDDADGFIANGTFPDVMGPLDSGKGECFKFTFYLDNDLVNKNGTQVDDDDFKGASASYTMQVDAEQIPDRSQSP